MTGAKESGRVESKVRRPESVLVVVHTPALEVLLLERVEPAGFWQSVTGTLHWDETPSAAAAREVVEETGLDPSGLRPANVRRAFPILPEWRARYAPDVDRNLEHWYYLEVPEAAEIVLDAAEHRAYRWLPAAAAAAAAASWTNREAIERLAASGEGLGGPDGPGGGGPDGPGGADGADGGGPGGRNGSD